MFARGLDTCLFYLFCFWVLKLSLKLLSNGLEYCFINIFCKRVCSINFDADLARDVYFEVLNGVHSEKCHYHLLFKGIPLIEM